MRVAVIDHGSGNLRSAAKAFERAAREAGLGAEIRVTAEPDYVRSADRLVLPGVGAFADCTAGLRAIAGLAEAMAEAVNRAGRPLLGICVGMQMLATVGREHGDHPGLDWIPGEVSRLQPGAATLKVPHMGWNDLVLEQPSHPLLDGIAPGDYAYFVHSYALRPADGAVLLASVDYGAEHIVAAVARGTVAGTQFHPEKSQATGLRLIGNFLRWAP